MSWCPDRFLGRRGPFLGLVSRHTCCGWSWCRSRCYFFIFINMLVWIFICTGCCVYIHFNICTNVCSFVFFFIYICIFMFMYLDIYMCMYIAICTSTHTPTFVMSVLSHPRPLHRGGHTRTHQCDIVSRFRPDQRANSCLRCCLFECAGVVVWCCRVDLWWSREQRL